MDKVSMSYFLSFSWYQTKSVTEFLFRQLITSWTLRFIFDHLYSGDIQFFDNQKIEYLQNEKSFLDEIKSFFHSF